MASRRVAYLTDVEGNLDYFHNYVAISQVLKWSDDTKSALDFQNEEDEFVFGGDSQDKGIGDVRFVRLLLKLKAKYPDRVHWIIGNRDCNKLRLAAELSDEAIQDSVVQEDKEFPYWVKEDARVTPADYLKEINEKEHTKANRLRWMLKHTMGADGAFERRKMELGLLKGRDSFIDDGTITDEEVVESFVKEVDPAATDDEKFMLQYLENGKLMHVFGKTLFVHGALKKENLGTVPGKSDQCTDVSTWVTELNAWATKEVADFKESPFQGKNSKTRAGHGLMDYGVPEGNGGKTVICAKFLVDGNAAKLEAEVVQQLEKDGIKTVVVGHIPHGDCPTVIRTRLTEGAVAVVMADTSYSKMGNKSEWGVDNRGSAVSEVIIYDDGTASVHGVLADGAAIEYDLPLTEQKGSKDDIQVGDELVDGSWIKAKFKGEDEYLTCKGKGFKLDVKRLSKAAVLAMESGGVADVTPSSGSADSVPVTKMEDLQAQLGEKEKEIATVKQQAKTAIQKLKAQHQEQLDELRKDGAQGGASGADDAAEAELLRKERDEALAQVQSMKEKEAKTAASDERAAGEGGESGVDERLAVAAEYGQQLLEQKHQLAEELAEVTKEKDELVRRLDDVSKENEEMLERLEEWKTFGALVGSEELPATPTAATHHVSRTAQKVEEMMREKAEQSSRIEELERRCNELEAANADLKRDADASSRFVSQIDKWKAAATEAEEKLGAAQQQLEELSADMQAAKERSSRLEADCAQYLEEVTRAQELLDAARAENAALASSLHARPSPSPKKPQARLPAEDGGEGEGAGEGGGKEGEEQEQKRVRQLEHDLQEALGKLDELRLQKASQSPNQAAALAMAVRSRATDGSAQSAELELLFGTRGGKQLYDVSEEEVAAERARVEEARKAAVAEEQEGGEAAEGEGGGQGRGETETRVSEEQLAAVEQQLAAVEVEFAGAREAVASLERELAAAREELVGAREAVEVRERELEEARAEAQGLRGELGRLEGGPAAVKAEEGEKGEEEGLKEAREEIARLEGEVGQRREEAEGLKEEVARLSRALEEGKEVQGSSEGAEAAAPTEEGGGEEEEEDLQRLRARLRMKVEEVEEVGRQLEAREREVARLEGDVKKLRGDVEARGEREKELEQELEQLREARERAGKQAEGEDSGDKKEDMENEAEQGLKEARDEIARLEGEVARLSRALEEGKEGGQDQGQGSSKAAAAAAPAEEDEGGAARQETDKQKLQAAIWGLEEALDEKDKKIQQLEEVGRFLEQVNLDLMARLKAHPGPDPDPAAPAPAQPQRLESASPPPKAASDVPAGHPSSDAMKLAQMERELMGEALAEEEAARPGPEQPAPAAAASLLAGALEEFSEGVPAPLGAQLRAALNQLLAAAAALPASAAAGEEAFDRAVLCLESMLECHFVMTLAGVVIANPKLKRADMEAAALSLEARECGVPFFELHSWIRAHLRDSKLAKAEDSDTENDANKPADISAEELAQIVDTPMNTPTKPQAATPASGKKTWFGFMRSSKPAAADAAPAASGAAASDIQVSAALQGNEEIEAIVRKFRHQKDLSKKLLQQNLYITEKLKKSVQRRRALEMALEQEQVDKEEESQRAAAVKQVCDLLSQQLAEKEDKIRSFLAPPAEEASEQPVAQFDLATL